MEITYELRRTGLGVYASLPLTQLEYDELATARQGLFEILATEEKFDLVLRNFASFERVIHESALTDLVFTPTSWSDFIEHIQVMSLALMNLLAMCRTYIEHVPHHLRAVFPEELEKIEAFQRATSHEYDSTLGYRVLYAVRNYAQHRSLPVHAITLDARWLGDPKECLHAAIPYLSLDALERGDFKRSLLDELQRLGPHIDIRPLVRQNMSAFGRLHGVVRDLVVSRAAAWDSQIIKWREAFAATHGNELVGLEIVELDVNKDVSRSHSLFDEMIKRRQYLQQKNQLLVNAEKHFISGQVCLSERDS